MPRPLRNAYVCQNCGATAARWAGKCAQCHEWNSLVEEASATAPPGTGLATASKGRVLDLESLAATNAPPMRRFSSGSAELDRVTGGGIVPGSALLIGGEPGIGKSTLLLEVAARLAAGGRRALYLSGAQAAAQAGLSGGTPGGPSARV